MAATAGTVTKKKNEKNVTLKAVIILALMVGLIVGFYYYLNNKTAQRTESVEKLTVAQELLTKNLSYNYPPSPKEVVRLYCEITKCFYNEPYSNEEMERLAGKLRELYDDELLAQNDWNQYLIDLTREIQGNKDKNLRISDYTLSASTDVKFYTHENSELARLYCTFMLQSGNNKQNLDEVFVLRKDDAGHWKILGWDHADKVKDEEE